MNTKYASKPNLNPNEPDLSRQVVPNPFTGEGPAYFSRRPRRLLNFDFCTLIFDFENVFQAFSRNEPNFKTQKTLISRQKRRNGGPKPTQKNETNPILTGA